MVISRISLMILLRDRTIREIKVMSRKKKVRLGDSEPDEHLIVFYKSKFLFSPGGRLTGQWAKHRPEERRAARNDIHSLSYRVASRALGGRR